MNLKKILSVFFGLALGIALFVVVIALVFHTSDKNTAPIVHEVLYSCNADKMIAATYYERKPAPSLPGEPPIPTGSVDLKLSDGRQMNLAQTISADGTRYANADESFVFWGKGNGALILENNVEKSYIGCIRVAQVSATSTLSQIYSNGQNGFSIRLPQDFRIDASAQNLIKFTIPGAVASGTNLSTDTYIAVETGSSTCALMPQSITVTDNGVSYSFASSSDAAAGNRYEESIYILPDTNPCISVHYLIHYGVFENYPAGRVKRFDKQAILEQFDQIRRTLVVVQ